LAKKISGKELSWTLGDATLCAEAVAHPSEAHCRRYALGNSSSRISKQQTTPTSSCYGCSFGIPSKPQLHAELVGQHLGESQLLLLLLAFFSTRLMLLSCLQAWWLGFPPEVRSIAVTTALSCFLAIMMVTLLMWISIHRSGLKQD
jgi:hypothetical protein